MVTADGSLYTANSCTNTDLFFASRGGGGGTFGVATRVVYKAHDQQSNYLKFNAALFGNCTDCMQKTIRTWVDFMHWTEENQPGMWGGHAYTIPLGEIGHLVQMFLLFTGSQEEAAPGRQFLEDTIAAYNNEFDLIVQEVIDFPNFLEWRGADSTDAVGTVNYALASRLIQSENLATPEAREALTDAIAQAMRLGTPGLFNFSAGKGTQVADPEGLTSITPAWRKTVAHFVGS